MTASRASGPTLAAIILAAGQGSRMGYRPKAAIRIAGRAVLEWQVSALREAGLADVSVVAGNYLDELAPLIERCGAHMVVNESGSPDLVTSQHAALRAHRERHPGADLVLLLGDLPLLRAQHFRRLKEAWQTRAAEVQALVPQVAGVRGHPVILSWAALRQMEATGGETEGIRGWMARHKASVQFLALDDPAYTQDLDTPADIEAVQKILGTP